MMRSYIRAMTAIFPLVAFGQVPQPQKIPWTTVSVPAADSMNITIPDGQFQHWVVGISVAAAESERIEVVDAAFRFPLRPSSSPEGPQYFPLAAHPASLISVSGTEISIGGKGQTLVAFVALSSGRRVNVTLGQRSVFSVSVNSGLLVADGVVKRTSAASDGQTLLAAFATFIGSAFSPPGGPITSRQGVNTVTDSRYLQSHLVRYVAFPSTGTGQPGAARVKLDIGADGTVQDVSCGSHVAATGLTCEAVAAVIKQWAFDPFLVNGQPSAVLAHVMIIATANAVTSTVSPTFSGGN